MQREKEYQEGVPRSPILPPFYTGKNRPNLYSGKNLPDLKRAFYRGTGNWQKSPLRDVRNDQWNIS